MKSESVLMHEAMEYLISNLGIVDAERFISIIKHDNFDYTEWRKELWIDKTVQDIMEEAYVFEKSNVST